MVFVCNELIAQSSHQIFEHLTTDHGLSSNKVEAVLQDKEGFYWIATQNGLNRFDGTNFKVFRNNSTDSTSLTHNNCTALAEGKNGDIWVATYKGVSRFIKSRGVFKPIYLHHPAKNFEITNRIYSLAVDKDDNVWIAGNGLWKYNIKTDSLDLFLKNPQDSLLSPPYFLITRMVYDQKNNGLWCTPGNGLNFFSIPENKFYNALYNPLGWKVFDNADSRELALDSTNRLWFRDIESQHLSYFDSDKNKITITSKNVDYGIRQIDADDKNRIWIFYWLAGSEIYTPSTELTDTVFFKHHHSRSMLSENAGSLFIDRDNNYWIGSGKGISIYRVANQYYKLHQINVKERGIQNEPLRINSMAQTISENIWIGTNLGLFNYILKDGRFSHIKAIPSLSNITSLCAYGDKLWIGIHDQLWCLDAKSQKIIKKIRIDPGLFFIQKGTHHDLWAGLWTGGLYRIDLKSDDIIHFTKGTANSIKSNNLITGLSDHLLFWVGYNGGIGFSKYSIPSDAWTHYHPQEEDLSNSNAGTVTVITKDNKDLIWLGTHGGGIFSYDTINDTYENYQQQQGLNSNYINSIISDAGGHLWISTADGMNYLNTEKNTIRSLDMGLIFSDNDFLANGIRGVNSKLYFFCNNEFVEIEPSAYKQAHAFPHLVISSFKIFDRDVGIPGDVINLSYRENFFSFTYSTIKTQPSKEVHYAFTLEGFDQDWNMAGSQQHASYTNVPDGKYTFKVKSTNDEGQWSDVLLSLPIHIKPPFWRTWWFLTLSIIFISAGIYGLYHMRIKQIKRIFSLRTKISQDLHDDIGGSLSSIHIYSSVAEKEMNANPNKSREFLQQISASSRQVMEDISDIVWANYTDQKAKSSLATRIKNYGSDLLSQKNIECKYVVDQQAEKKLSKPEARRNILLIIKEALNNMAKYSEASFAEVNVSVNGAQLLVAISDNGKGFDTQLNGHGNGLHNMKKRAELLGGNFRLISTPGRGTSIQCRIPLTNISDR